MACFLAVIVYGAITDLSRRLSAPGFTIQTSAVRAAYSGPRLAREMELVTPDDAIKSINPRGHR